MHSAYHVVNKNLSKWSRLQHLTCHIRDVTLITFWYFKCLYVYKNLLFIYLFILATPLSMVLSGILAPGPGIEPALTALEGEVLTTGLPGSPLYCYFKLLNCLLFLQIGSISCKCIKSSIGLFTEMFIILCIFVNVLSDGNFWVSVEYKVRNINKFQNV